MTGGSLSEEDDDPVGREQNRVQELSCVASLRSVMQVHKADKPESLLSCYATETRCRADRAQTPGARNHSSAAPDSRPPTALSGGRIV
jgi:hypothetical protein